MKGELLLQVQAALTPVEKNSILDEVVFTNADLLFELLEHQMKADGCKTGHVENLKDIKALNVSSDVVFVVGFVFMLLCGFDLMSG